MRRSPGTIASRCSTSRFKLSWRVFSAVSFTTYALSHNIGMSMFSGAMVRYRAYSTKGLTVGDIGVLVAFCSFTFALGTILLGGIVLAFEPDITERLFQIEPWLARLAGLAMLLFVALYVGGSALHLRPLAVGTFKLVYPRLPVAARQLLAGPLELLGAAGIIWCALPAEHNPALLHRARRVPGLLLGGAPVPRAGRARRPGVRLREGPA